MWRPEDNVISVDDLVAIQDDPKTVIFDCSYELTNPDAGHKLYTQGHIPNSIFAYVTGDLAEPPGERGRHPLPTREVFLDTVRSWGVKNDSHVISYDQGLAIFACRLWWMFRWLGHEKVSVLDGGLSAWKAAGQPLSTDVNELSHSMFEPKDALTSLVDANDVLNHNGVLIDARAENRFRGEIEPIDHTAGHIPGAICRPSSKNLDESFKFTRDGSRFDVLTDDAEVICYCGSGISATHNILSIILAGHKEPSLYSGSWSEWIEDPSRPVVTG
ncbi:MAG: sulfurtransferase [Gammaproteobacteria bacterium]|nr:sulfurtransferase [Gammaproteobacteria bacterium]